MEKTGVLEKKLTTYYADTNLKDYKDNFLLGLSKYSGKTFNRILDIGSGVGSFADAIRPFGYELDALEASDFGYKKCTEKGINCHKFFLEKGKALPFKTNTFSLVFMNQVIEHVTKDVGQYYIGEILRVLEPGGVAIINSPSRYSKIWNTDPNHLYCWRPNELLGEVRKYSDLLSESVLQRSPLEFWMMKKYDEAIIDEWHKYNKHPKVKRNLRMIVKVIDRIISKISDTDILLAAANIVFVKKVN